MPIETKSQTRRRRINCVCDERGHPCGTENGLDQWNKSVLGQVRVSDPMAIIAVKTENPVTKPVQ